MKKRATLLATALLATGAWGALSPASAAPACNLVVDPAGDAGVGILTTGPRAPGDAADDVLSADLASDGKTITGVIRMAELRTTNTSSPLGQTFNIEFAAPGNKGDKLFLAARLYPTGNKFAFGYVAPDPNSGLNTSYSLGEATGVLDVANKQLRLSAPVAGFAESGAKLSRGTKLTLPSVRVFRNVGQGVVPSQEVGGVRVPLGGLSLVVDSTEETKAAYTVGSQSCVAVGK